MYKSYFAAIPFLAIVTLLLASITPVQASQSLQQDDATFSFAAVREKDIRMFGPFAAQSVFFGLPSNWQIQEGANLTLDMRVSIRSLTSEAAVDAPTAFIGSLEINLNGDTIAVLPLASDDLVTEIVPIPLDALAPSRLDGRMELSFLLSSGETCVLDQQLELVILSSSRFFIPHTIVPPDTSWLSFPRPIYQDSIFSDSARIVVSDKPSAAELQSALTVAAGLQARTGSGMQLDMVTSRELTEDKLADNHLIFVGKPSSIPLMSQLILPMGVKNGAFDESGEAGVLEMVASPWSPDRVVVVVSGNSDDAIIKAAQSLSTGAIRPNRVPNLALVDQVQGLANRTNIPVSQSFSDLGYGDVVFEGRGETAEAFQFYIPVGLTVTTEAFLDLSLNYTTLLNFNQSGLYVLLNDQPIGSVRLTEATANQPNNHVRVAIPPSAVKSGLNNLEVVGILQPIDECGDPNQDSLFLTIWADESSLFLPLIPIPANINYLPDLAAYPSPFIQSASLDTTAFVLDQDNPDTWRHALAIAEDLGAIADGVIMKPSVFFADSIPADAKTKYHMLIIGAPSKLPVITELNDRLPAPFAEGSDMATEKDMQITYRITPDTPVGYLELLESPWNKNNVVLAVLGNLPLGIDWSARALTTDDIKERLAGNFVVINDTQTFSVDTRLSDILEFTPVLTATPSVNLGGTSVPVNVSTAKPGWILIALGVIGVSIVIVVVVALITSWRRNRQVRGKS